MPIYEKMQNAFNTRDTTGYLDLLHEDYQFVRHQSRTTMSKSQWTEVATQMMNSDSLIFRDLRCLYENDEILVEHSVIDFPDGTTEAVLAVHLLKNGKLIRTETGATPISN